MSSPHRRSRPLLRSVLLSNAAVLAATLAVATATPLTPLTAQGATHPITAADISAWKTIRGATLSHDGAWFAPTSSCPTRATPRSW